MKKFKVSVDYIERFIITKTFEIDAETEQHAASLVSDMVMEGEDEEDYFQSWNIIGLTNNENDGIVDYVSEEIKDEA